MAARGPTGGARGGLNNRFAQFKLVLLGMFRSVWHEFSRQLTNCHF